MRKLLLISLVIGALWLVLPMTATSQPNDYTCPAVGFQGCSMPMCQNQPGPDGGVCVDSNGNNQTFWSVKQVGTTYYQCLFSSEQNCVNTSQLVCTAWFYFNYDCDPFSQVCPALMIKEPACALGNNN